MYISITIMNVIIPYHLFKIKKILYQKHVLNKISYYKWFYRILYNEDAYTIQNILISIPPTHIITNKSNKHYKISFSNALLFSLFKIEYDLLKNINHILHKKIERLLYNDCIYKRYILNLNEPIHHLYLRISGIWETNDKIGIIYKFIQHGRPCLP